ncbi:creatininase family protein [Roseobacter sp. YSTF-M11]|uniref:Creatininase family protein n=1 Tax=Roseobacter insulae TaxID=2859783 RepID=A0A9X1FYJ8_9RHOB|nr:creatininase family protein [Roseobacter insulae]MBW4710094.1 creatininase family protein [Roseobacter insulae]
MTTRDWADFRAPDFREIDPLKTIAVLPTAAIEQHGPHLPVGTDMLIAQGMLEELRHGLPRDMDVRILPVQAVGKSNEHLWAEGTLSLTATTALSVWTEIGLSVARAGVRKIAIVNSHGGNLDLVSILTRELRVQAGMLAVKCQWGSFGTPDGTYSENELQYGIHGGDLETSLMLHFRPDTVDMRAAKAFRSTAQDTTLQPVGPVSYGWIASDLNPEGTVGEAHLATAEKGATTAQHQVAGFISLLRTIEEAPLPAS